LACLERDKSREEKNILGSLQRATDKETGAKLSFGELVINSHTLLLICLRLCLTRRVAGADTTAVSMTFGLYYIVAIPKVWDRLSREIRSRFDKIEDINGQSTGQLQFLDAVIHESDLFASLQLT
jgi:cytochrome P450